MDQNIAGAKTVVLIVAARYLAKKNISRYSAKNNSPKPSCTWYTCCKEQKYFGYYRLAIRIYVVMSHMAVVIDPAIERQPVWVVVGPAEYESNAMAM